MTLRDPGAVLLLSIYELGHQPHGITLPAAFLERAGFQPVSLDLSRCRLDEPVVRHARFIGISVPMHTALRAGVAALRRIRVLNPDAFVCCYGLYAWLNGEYLLDGLADGVIGGEFEQSLVDLLEDLAQGGSGQAAGVWRTGPRIMPVLERLSFPVASPAGLAGPEAYARLLRDGDEVIAGYAETTRGCLHTCRHCPIPPVYGGRFFAIPRATVLENIRRQAAQGAGHITFGDPDFLNGPTHGLRIARAMHQEFPALTFDITAKVEHLLRHTAILPELAELGCLFIVSAVESLSDRVLDCLHKGHTRADVYAALAAVRRAGITLRPSLLPFTPWSTLDDYIDLLRWAEAEALVDDIDPVHWSIRLLVPPGSSLLHEASMQPHLGDLDAAALMFRWHHPDPRVDRLHETVSALVARRTAAAQPPRAIFAEIREAAAFAAGTQAPALTREWLDARPRSPRLTEPWFCCAEPLHQMETEDTA